MMALAGVKSAVQIYEAEAPNQGFNRGPQVQNSYAIVNCLWTIDTFVK